MNIEKIKINHKDFSNISSIGWNALPVVVFQRTEWNTITKEQQEEFDRNEEIVQAHGGAMIKSKWQLNGKTPEFTLEDIDEMLRLTMEALPDYEFNHSWNGKGYRAFSISIKPKEISK